MNLDIKIPFHVIETFALRNDISVVKSVEIHSNLLEYLDEGSVIKSAKHSPSKLVDEAWHAFILHTKDYHTFCEARYGEFIHHYPHSKNIDAFSKVAYLISNERGSVELAKCNDCGNSDN